MEPCWLDLYSGTVIYTCSYPTIRSMFNFTSLVAASMNMQAMHELQSKAWLHSHERFFVSSVSLQTWNQSIFQMVKMFICHFGITTIIKVICMIVQSIDHNRSFKTCETKLHAWHVTWLCSLTQEPSTEILKFAAASSRDDVEDGRLLGCCPVLTALSTADPKKSDKKLHFIRIFTLFWSPKKIKTETCFRSSAVWIDVLMYCFSILLF